MALNIKSSNLQFLLHSDQHGESSFDKSHEDLLFFKVTDFGGLWQEKEVQSAPGKWQDNV